MEARVLRRYEIAVMRYSLYARHREGQDLSECTRRRRQQVVNI